MPYMINSQMKGSEVLNVLSKYKAGQSLKMVAEAKNLNLLKNIRNHTVSGLKIYDPLENYYFM